MSEVKIGARTLDKEELKILLPNNEELDEQIVNIRKVAKAVREQRRTNKKGKYEENFSFSEFDKDYNNVFSILGGRGSGKTSVLLTLKKRYTPEKTHDDIMLPLIVPEEMSEGSNMLGWMISLFEEEVQKIEKEMSYIERERNETENNYYKNGSIIKNNPLRKKYNELKRNFFLRKLQLQVEHFGKMAANSCSIKAVEKCIKKFFWSLIAESFTRAAI